MCWEWQRDDGSFSPYHPLVSHWIEAAFMKGANQFTAAQCVIDFDSMTRTGTGGGMIEKLIIEHLQEVWLP